MNLAQRDRQVIWHPFTPQKSMIDPIAIAAGEGVYLIDENGKKYIDAISSWWVNLHGHSHPYIAEKIYEQAKKLEQVIFAGFTHEPAVLLAERILPLLPGHFSKIFYSDNGSTATEVAIKMALQYWWNREASGLSSLTLAKEGVGPALRSFSERGSREFRSESQQPEAGSRASVANEEFILPDKKPRNKILAFNNSYHGDTFGAMSVSDRSVFTLAFQDKLFEVLFIDPLFSPGDQLPTIDWNCLACFIYEPLIQGAGGMKMHDPGGLNKLLKKCKEHNVVCIADEVMTGFGRTGKLFASEYCEVKPDIICLSKGITGGTMALGVTACSEKIYAAFVTDDKLKTFFHGHSFTANPLACTAALASLDLLLKEDCFLQRLMIESANKQFLAGLIPRFSHLIKNQRSLGTILAFEIVQGNDEYLNNISSIITQKALDNLVYLRPLGNTLYIMPPFCISRQQLDKVYDTIIHVLEHS